MDLEALRKQKQQRKQAEATFRAQTTINESIIPISKHSDEADMHFDLAKCYWEGIKGYPEDEVKAMSEYLKAAEFGHTAAMREVGYDYMDSDESILGYDLQKAEMWGKRAIELGDQEGYKILADIQEEKGNGYEAFKLLEEGVVKGSRDCIERLAGILYWGADLANFEVKEDVDRSLKLLTSVKWDDDYSIALELLGHIYRDQEKPYLAKEYYDKALKADPEAYGVMASLGAMLRSVEEVRDYGRARTLLYTAAEHGNYMAMNGYGVMLYSGEDTDQDVDGAIEWFKRSAEGGYTQAMINLGDIFSDNNPKEAIFWYNLAKEHGDDRGEERLQEMGGIDDSNNSIDTSRSDKIYDNFLNNLENTFNLSPLTILNSGFPNRIEGIQKVIDKGDLSSFEADRLKILQGWLSLCYFRRHFLDEDFSDYKGEYYKILDAVDDYISSMSEISDEGAYIYYISNMYSADRFEDVNPIEKLEEFWSKLSEIELDETFTEFKVEFWKDLAQEVYDIMSDLLDSKSNYSNAYDSYDKIKDKVITIIADKLSLDEDEVHLYSRLVQDLGADSLDSVELIMEMEKEFGLTIPDEDAEGIRTVGDIVTYVRAHC